MRKNGHDRNGRQRWQCDACKATTTISVGARSRAATLRLFLDWLLEPSPQRRLECDARTFRRRIGWCWDLAPRIRTDGVVHHVVMADGTYVGDRCLLIAIDGQDGETLAWQWCDRESTAAYRALFERIAPPDVLVCDGMKGIRKACAQVWSQTLIQRCLVHVQRDTRTDLSCKHRLQAGRELKKLSDMLTRIHDAETATGWWWTHLPLRNAYFRLERLFRDRSLFCFLEPRLQTQGPVPRDSNRLEGGINAKIKLMLLNHRGMPEKHMKRACEWYCYMKSAAPDPTLILKEHDRHDTAATHETDENDITQPTLGTGIDWNEFHTRTRYPNATE